MYTYFWIFKKVPLFDRRDLGIFSELRNWAVQRLRRVVTGLLPGRTGLVHVRLVADNVILEQIFSPSSSIFPCQYHFTMALHAHTSSGRWTVDLLVTAVQRHSLTPSTWTREDTIVTLLNKFRMYLPVRIVLLFTKLSIQSVYLYSGRIPPYLLGRNLGSMWECRDSRSWPWK
jgi:hypothetical protein